MKVYHASPEYKARTKMYRASPKYQVYQKSWESNPKNMAWRKARQSTPERKARAKVQRSTLWAKAQIIANRCRMPIEIPNRPHPESCECCGNISERTLHLDHCHNTGRFRGWCCHQCNTGNGIADNPKLLRLRALYVERPFQVGPIRWAYPKGWKVSEVA